MAFLSFKWLVPVLAAFFHPMYVSVTEITHNPREKQLEVSCKLFAEDLEDVLQRATPGLDLSAEPQHARNDKLVAAYMQKNLSLAVDGKAQALHYLGFEKEKEALYCYFEVAGVSAAPHKVDVQNALLYDFSEKQINLVHVTVNGKRQSTKLDYPNKGASFSF
ncbi:MAG: hypothetical protein EOO16_22565 [Chitinophagaceae bacterium]|nr:MAG: hypothetical protein EOO16_22565 [Chitinophagaceae bacterium]